MNVDLPYKLRIELGNERGEALDFAAEAAAYRRASEIYPMDASFLLRWFVAAAKSRRFDGLHSRIRQSLPDLAEYRDLVLDTAQALARSSQSSVAFALLSKLHAQLPNDSLVARSYGVERMYAEAFAKKRIGNIAEAIEACSALLEVEQAHHSGLMMRASLLAQRGEVEAALADLSELRSQYPNQTDISRAYLTTMQYVPGIGAEAVAAAHREWANANLVGRLEPTTTNFREAKKELRVGWISPIFCPGLVTDLLLPTLRLMKSARISLILYDSGEHPSSATAEFRDVSDEWHCVSDLSDDELCQKFTEDKIDMIVELSGHSIGNRLGALMSHPVPVQISWLDYFHSTGSSSIDFFISDAVISPPELDCHYAERVIRLPSGRLCFTEPTETPEICERSEGEIRFASFNRINKLNGTVVAAWAEILNQVPNSVLRLKAASLDIAENCEYLFQRFARLGIAKRRIELKGFGSRSEVFEDYADVDIALDPFPFSGCLTTFDALWMGIPVVSCLGDTAVSRQSASLLTSVGLTALICASASEYIQCASELAVDRIRLASYRERLRPSVRENLCNSKRHASELSSALRLAWKTCGASN